LVEEGKGISTFQGKSQEALASVVIGTNFFKQTLLFETGHDAAKISGIKAQLTAQVGCGHIAPLPKFK
jgi:hypothetical protein